MDRMVAHGTVGHGSRKRALARRRQHDSSTGPLVKFVLVMLISHLTSVVCSAAAEREILVEFYEATNGDSWKKKENWKTEDVCTWYGIGCSANKKVQSITLARNNLNGSVPPSLWKLQALQHVNLRMNLLTSLSLTGLFTSDPQNQPRSPLETLMVSDNHLTDLRGIADAGETLKDLNANKNRIDKPALEDLSLLMNLQTLYIAFNQIPGTIPTHIGRLTKLSSFYAFDNRLTGAIPSEIGLLDQVQICGLGNNLLTGTLPTEMEQMVNIRDLSLHHVRKEESTVVENGVGLSGPLLSFGAMPYLSLLFLDGNRLTGSIPSDFLRHNTHTDTPISVGLTSNQLTGTLPMSLERFEALSIDVAENRITGIPEELCQKGGWMGGLVEQLQCDAILCAPGMYASQGRATGSEDPCLKCDSEAGSNWFGSTECETPDEGSSGNDADWVALGELYAATRGVHWIARDGWEMFDGLAKGEESLSDLARQNVSVCDGWFGVVCDESKHVIEVVLPGNRLYGDLPDSFFTIPTLETVDLSNNNVQLPGFQEISPGNKLTVLNFSNVRLQSIEGIGELTGLLELRIDGQALDQSLPLELFHLTSLQTLHLQQGRFFGKIPSEIGLLTSLVDLNIYGNLLSGQLPNALGSLTKLQALDLSENQFEGDLPDISSLTDLNTFRIHQSEGVKNIGGPLPPFDTFPLLREVNLEFNALTGVIPDRFLMGVADTTSDITISLGYNQIEGAIPESLHIFDKLILELEGNKITSIPEALCSKAEWMNGAVGALAGQNATRGCEAILCPPLTWNYFGIATITDPCIACDTDPSLISSVWASWYGRVSCGDITPTREKEILDKLFIGTGGRYWTVPHENWLRPGVPICQREGVECLHPNANEGIVELRMNRFGLRGTIPSEIWELSHARQLAFTNNEVEVSFEGIEKATALKVLKLSMCHIRSLEGIENVSSGLSELHLAKNQFNGTVPEQIFSLKQVSNIFLSGNNFGGKIPTELATLTGLRQLDLSDNRFTGSLPSELGLLQGLVTLELQLNELYGTVPAELQVLQNLQHLDISQQVGAKLEGVLPLFERCPALVHLDMSQNSFSGPLPSNILAVVNPSSEIFLNLAKNRLEGNIPSEWGRFEALTVELGGNRLTGLPVSLCSLNEWQKGLVGLLRTCDVILCPPGTAAASGRQTVAFDSCTPCAAGVTSAPFFGATACLDPRLVHEKQVLSNFYEGANGTNWLIQTDWLSDRSVCDWYGVLCNDNQHVIEIKLDTNMVAGSSFQVSDILTLEDLTTLDLNGNSVQLNFAKVPEGTKLEYLGLSATQMKSMTGISRATSLRAFHATDNEIRSIPDEIFFMSNLESLFLSYNIITGRISRNFGELSSLKELYLFGNRLTGTIPSELSMLSNLTEIVLARNFLSGTLPAGLSSLPKLEQLSIYEQQGAELITGPVPSFSAAPKLALFDASNNDLTGPIPDNFMANAAVGASISIYLRNNDITGTVPLELKRFESLDINLADNKILVVPQQLCEIGGWMNGKVGSVASCGAILCPKGTFNQFGHESPGNPCLPCEQLSLDPYLGHTRCEDFTSERETLSKLYEGTGGEFWTSASNWRSEAPICSWEGVACENGDRQDAEGITSIRLDANGLSGTLPSEVWTLPSLRMLSLNNNPQLVVNLEGLKVAAQTLEVLYLSQTKMKSLEGISAATSLKELHITGNGIEGSFPEELFALSNTIEALHLAENHFWGSFPTKLGEMTNIRSIFAYKNDFLSTIPSELGKLKYLNNLVLAENMFYGSIPSELSVMPSLEVLAIFRKDKSGPRLSGSLPALDKIPQLKELYLHGNSLEGSIPSNFLSASRKAKMVHLSGNVLTGSAPADLSEIPNLTLQLEGNKIGGLPQILCDNGAWMEGVVAKFGCDAVLCSPGTASPLGRAENSSTACLACPKGNAAPFFGSLSCDAWLNDREILMNLFYALGGTKWHRRDFWGSTADVCEWYGIGCVGGNVAIVNLHGNNLHGLPGPDLFDLPELRILWLYSNPIEFSFENIGNAKKLQDLRLDSTNLHSLHGIGKATSLTSFDAGFSSLRGAFPAAEILPLTNLRTLHLNNNFISGSLPKSFAAIEFLTRLRLDSNLLSGSLPSFEEMSFLEYVDISNNQLVGPIPHKFLESLNAEAKPTVRLSTNQLTGVVPQEFDRFVDMTVHLSENQFLGLPVILCDNKNWNYGHVGKYGCDAILCRPGTANEVGRRTADLHCQKCTAATYFGDTSCTRQVSSSAEFRSSSVALGAVACLAVALAFSASQ